MDWVKNNVLFFAKPIMKWICLRIVWNVNGKLRKVCVHHSMADLQFWMVIGKRSHRSVFQWKFSRFLNGVKHEQFFDLFMRKRMILLTLYPYLFLAFFSMSSSFICVSRSHSLSLFLCMCHQCVRTREWLNVCRADFHMWIHTIRENIDFVTVCFSTRSDISTVRSFVCVDWLYIRIRKYIRNRHQHSYKIFWWENQSHISFGSDGKFDMCVSEITDD